MSRKSLIPLTIEIEAASWARKPALAAQLQTAADAVAAHVPEALRERIAGYGATVLLTTDAAVRVLNRDWRGKDSPTNVLSFPQYAPRALKTLPVLKRGAVEASLGDIAVAYQTTAREAREEGKSFDAHATHLVVHGVLHLLGYDHIAETPAVKMEKLETKILAALGIEDPYTLRGKRS